MSVTEALAEYVTHSTYEAIPRAIRDEAKRAIVNYLGCALGGAVEPALDVAIKTLAPYSGNATACVLGRAERFDALHAALQAVPPVPAPQRPMRFAAHWPEIRLPELTRDGFVDLYPLLPYQIDLIIQIVSGLASKGGSSRWMMSPR